MIKLLLILFSTFSFSAFTQTAIHWDKLSHNLPSSIYGFSTDDEGNIFACTQRGIFKSTHEGQDWTIVKLLNTEGRIQSFQNVFFDDKMMFLTVGEINNFSQRPCAYINEGTYGSSEIMVNNGIISQSAFYQATKCIQGTYSGESGPFVGFYEYWGNGIVKRTGFTSCYVRYSTCGSSTNVISYNRGNTWQSFPNMTIDSRKRRIFGVKNTTYFALMNDTILSINLVEKQIPFDKNHALLNVFYHKNTILYCQKNGRYTISMDEGETWKTDSLPLKNIKTINLNLNLVGDTLILQATTVQNEQDTEGWYIADFNALSGFKPLYINGLTTPHKLTLLQKLGNTYIGQTTKGQLLLSKDGGASWQLITPRNLGIPTINKMYGRQDSLIIYVKDYGWYFTKNDNFFQPFIPTENLNSELNYSGDTIISGNKGIYKHYYQDAFTANGFRNKVQASGKILPFKSPRFELGNLYQCYSADGYAFQNDSLYCFSNYFGIYRTIWQNIACQTYIETPTILKDTICRYESRIFFGDTLHTEGVYSKTLKSIETGCDSIVQLELTFKRVIKRLYGEACPNTPFVVFKSDTFFKPYKYENIITKSDLKGCDSVTYFYIYTPQIRTQLSETICEGHSYDLEGIKVYLDNNPKYFNFNYKTKDGCDSLVSLSLYPQRPQNPVVLSQEINYCTFQKGKYDFYGRTISSVGTYYYVPDCQKDTMIQLKVVRKDIPITYLTVKINIGDTYRGLTLYNDFNFYDTFNSFNQTCDSIVITNVVVKTTALTDLDETRFQVYPNPFKDNLTLNIVSNYDILKVDLLDILGKTVEGTQNIFSKNKEKYGVEINTFAIPSGIYFLKLSLNNGYIVKKVVKSD